MKTSRNSTQKMRASVQNGIDDKIHNDGIDHGEIELTTCLNGQDEKAKYQNMKEKAEKMSLRPNIVSKPKGRGHTLITLAHRGTYLVCKMLTTVL